MIDPSFFRDTTVLVTGGAGFLGSALSRRLLSFGAKVVCVDNFSTGTRAHIADLERHPHFTFVQGDCNRREELLRVFEETRPEYVYHYAAVVGVKRTVEHPLLVLDDLNGLRNVYEISVLFGVKKLIFSSSSEAYGEPVELPEREDGVFNAKFPYALVKLIGEQYGAAMQKEKGFRYTALRFFNVYGPGQESSDYGFVVGIFIRQVLEGKPPTIFGDGLQTRDFVFLDDNINVALRAMQSDTCDGHVINVGAGRQITIKELAETVLRVLGSSLSPVYLPARIGGEIRHRCPDVTKCRTLIGTVSDTPLEEGIRRTAELM